MRERLPRCAAPQWSTPLPPHSLHSLAGLLAASANDANTFADSFAFTRPSSCRVCGGEKKKRILLSLI